MRISLLIIFMFLMFYLTADIKTGIIKSSGYKKFIYSQTFSDEIVDTPEQQNGKRVTKVDNFNLIFSPTTNLYLEFERREDRFHQRIEFNYYPESYLTIKQINLYSETINTEDQLIHHGIYFKRNGLFTFGGLFLTNFSLIDKQGYKADLFSQLKLYNLSVFSLIEQSTDYISPYHILQDNGLSIKNRGIILPFPWLEATLENNILLREEYLERSNKFSVKIGFDNNICLDSKIRDRKKREFSNGLTINSKYNIFVNKIKCQIKYINSPFYSFSEKLTIIPIQKISISALYKYYFDTEYKQEITSTFKINKGNWLFTLKYYQPLSSKNKTWAVEGLVNLTKD